jgi:nucleotide-binding universal stress UspA family protein
MRALVGIDLRIADHDWLLERAGAYAQRLGATVDLVYLQVEGADVEVPMRRLEGLLASLPEGVRGRARVEAASSPEEGLVQLTAEYDLMVVGNREPRALERLLKGPMASRVLRQARCPVLVPRGDDPPAEGARVLVGIDLRGIAPGRVLEMAGTWARHLGGRLDALYAVAGRLPHIPDKSVREAAEREWDKRQEPLKRELEELMIDYLPEEVRGEALLARGEAEDVLVSRSSEADVVLVGNREREGLARLLLGAVAQQVVRRADCDVISLPTALTLD